MDDPESKAAWLAFCIAILVEHRAVPHASDNKDLLVKVNETLIALGIPRDGSYQVARESGHA